MLISVPEVVGEINICAMIWSTAWARTNPMTPTRICILSRCATTHRQTTDRKSTRRQKLTDKKYSPTRQLNDKDKSPTRQLKDKSLLYFFTKLITILNFDFTNL